jgi:hypothetical protein
MKFVTFPAPREAFGCRVKPWESYVLITSNSSALPTQWFTPRPINDPSDLPNRPNRANASVQSPVIWQMSAKRSARNRTCPGNAFNRTPLGPGKVTGAGMTSFGRWFETIQSMSRVPRLSAFIRLHPAADRRTAGRHLILREVRFVNRLFGFAA